VLSRDHDVAIDDRLRGKPWHRGTSHVLDGDDRYAGCGERFGVLLAQGGELLGPRRVVVANLDHPRHGT
jgi:hypothetical protein